MNVIFLDVDGVLNHGHGFPVPALVDIFNNVVKKSNAEVVISSSWRIVRSPTDLRNVNKVKKIIRNVIGETPIINGHVDDWGEKIRVKEISQWLSENTVRNFAVIDDLELEIDNFFQTREDIGITHRIADAMIKHFTGEKPVSDDFDDAIKKGLI